MPFAEQSSVEANELTIFHSTIQSGIAFSVEDLKEAATNLQGSHVELQHHVQQLLERQCTYCWVYHSGPDSLSVTASTLTDRARFVQLEKSLPKPSTTIAERDAEYYMAPWICHPHVLARADAATATKPELSRVNRPPLHSTCAIFSSISTRA
jgi:hypothetical protein